LDEALSTQVDKNLFYVGKTSALVYDQAGPGESDKQGGEDPEAENEAKDEGETEEADE
jgi:hypothetical protein